MTSRLLRPQSLRVRVTAIGAATVALVLGFGAWATVQALSSQLRSDLNQQNAEVIETLAEAITDGADPKLLFLPAGADGTEFTIESADGHIINSSLLPFLMEDSSVSDTNPANTDWQKLDDIVVLEVPPGVAQPDSSVDGLGVPIADAPPPDPIEGEISSIPLDELDPGQWFETTRTVAAPSGDELTIVAFSPLGLISRSVDRLAIAMAIIVPFLVVAGAVALWCALGAALDPVRRISAEARRIAPSNSGDRLPVPDSGDEIAALTVTLNDMLDRLDAGLIRQRQFVSDASHELRSPLTTARGMAELLEERTDLPADVDGNVQALGRSTRRLELILDDLTDLAASGTSRETHDFDLGDVINAEVAQLEGFVEPIKISTSGVRPMVATGQAVPIGRAIHNLLTNAVRHATSRVEISTEITTGQVRIVVDDDGPGVSEADQTRIFERFVRLDEGRSRHGGNGSGLGLALVAAIAQDHGGTVSCLDSPLGGARFVLEF